MKKIRNILTLALSGLFLAGFLLAAILTPDRTDSLSERRKLAQRPALRASAVRQRLSPGPSPTTYTLRIRPSPIQGNRPQGYRHGDAVSCVFSRPDSAPCSQGGASFTYIVRPGDAPDKLGGSESPLHCHELAGRIGR